jgi:uncharacterized protein
MSIAEEEDGDKEVIGAAALVHDLHRIIGDGFTHPADSIYKVGGGFLDRANYEGSYHKSAYCVAEDEEYDFEQGKCGNHNLEAEIVQDADNLDAMGCGRWKDFQVWGSKWESYVVS